MKIDTTERFITALEEEPQGYRHFLNTLVPSPVTALGTIGYYVLSRTLSPTLVKAR